MAEKMKSPERKKLFKTGDAGKIIEAIKSGAIDFEKDIPDEVKTAEICLAAVKENGMGLSAVPKDIRTKEICLAALANAPGNGYGISLIEYVPTELLSEELCIAAVKHLGCALGNIPNEFKTPEVCLTAVQNAKNNGKHPDDHPYSDQILTKVPEQLLTYELCLAAVKHSGRAIAYVPENFITKELCMEAVKEYGEALRHVPEDLKTLEMCIEAVKNDKGAFKFFVPDALKAKVKEAVGWKDND